MNSGFWESNDSSRLPLCMSSVVEWKWRHFGVSGFEGLWGGGIGSGISCSRSPYARCAVELTDVDSVWPHRVTLLLWQDVWRVIVTEKRLGVLRRYIASRLHANSWTVMSCFFSRWYNEWVSCHTEAGFITASGKKVVWFKKKKNWSFGRFHYCIL